MQNCEEDKALNQVIQRTCKCSIPGIVQGQVGCNSEQPAVVKDVPVHGRGPKVT